MNIFLKPAARHKAVVLKRFARLRVNSMLPLSSIPYWKRGLDLSLILATFPLALPLMAMIGLWIKLVSRGPVFFPQERIGRDGVRFVLYKFRSMRMNPEFDRQESYVRDLIKADRPMVKLDFLCDPRLITGGHLLRASGFDELPQLFNVLRGEMSLVGPRPCLPHEYSFYSLEQRRRFQVLPGLTGSWQVKGKNRSTFIEMNVMDIHYVHHSSLMMDLKIMMRTPASLVLQIRQAFSQNNQCHDFQKSAAKLGLKYPTAGCGQAR